MGDENIFNYRNKGSIHLANSAVELIVLFRLEIYIYIYIYNNTDFQIFKLGILPLHFVEILQISGRGFGTPNTRKQMQIINC